MPRPTITGLKPVRLTSMTMTLSAMPDIVPTVVHTPSGGSVNR